jgi:hypothetical protein
VQGSLALLGMTLNNKGKSRSKINNPTQRTERCVGHPAKTTKDSLEN